MVCHLYATNLKVKVQIHIELRCIYLLHTAFVLYGHSISLSTLIAFVICAKWTDDIYYPHIKLSNYPYVKISSTAKQLMSLSIFRT